MTSPLNSWNDSDGLRWYTFGDKDYLSVTSMRKVLGLPFTLHRWVIKQTLEGIQKNPDSIVPLPGENPANVRTRLVKQGEAPRDVAAEKGTAVHGYIADNVPLSEVPVELRPYVEAYAKAVIELGIKPILVERTVVNDRYGYAGSFDMLAKVREHNNETVIVDLKTGKGAYAEYALQVYAYLKGEAVMNGEKVDEKATKALRKATGAAILHINPELPNGYEYHRIRIDSALDLGFRALGTLSQWMVTYKDLASLEEN